MQKKIMASLISHESLKFISYDLLVTFYLHFMSSQSDWHAYFYYF